MGTALGKRIIVATVLCLTIVFGTALTFAAKSAAPAAKPGAKAPAAKAATLSSQDVWKGARKAWSSINSYSCNLFAWNYKTQWFIDHFPEHRNKEGKPDKVDWSYRIYGVRFKKPDKALVTYDMSKNEKTEEGSVIDRGVAYVLTYVPGTLLINGVKDKKLIYIVFPYITNQKFSAMPISIQWKAVMKVLMIASRGEVYWKLIDNMKDARGNTIADLSIGSTMNRYEKYFKQGKVTVSMSPRLFRSDFNISKSGWLTAKKVSRPADLYKLTMIPNDVKKNRGISKVETFIDPKTMMFVGLMEYENGKLAQVMLFSDLKTNIDLPDKLWVDPFKGRRLSDKK
jgi:hypothetical protein